MPRIHEWFRKAERMTLHEASGVVRGAVSDVSGTNEHTQPEVSQDYSQWFDGL